MKAGCQISNDWTTGSSTATPAQLLAMTALGLADDLRTAEARLKQVEELTRTTVQQAIARIDAHLSAAEADEESSSE